LKRPKIAVIGAAGLVGSRLFAAYRSEHPDLIGTDWKGRGGLRTLDLANPDISGLRLAETGHRAAVIAAVGSKRFDVCETKKDYTRARNVDGTVDLGRRLRGAGLMVVHISTDGVFGGERGGYRETDEPEPVNEYGRQKRAAEVGLLEATGGAALVLRVGQIFGAKMGDGTLPDQIAGRLAAGETVDAAFDQAFTPTALDDLPDAIAALVAAGARGLCHLAGPESWTRLAVAQRLAEGLGSDRSKVRRISLDQIPGEFARPKNLSLKCERLKELGLALTPASRVLDLVIANYLTKETESL
jgi:dTDP-4-dehydrorhamnose reductase